MAQIKRDIERKRARAKADEKKKKIEKRKEALYGDSHKKDASLKKHQTLRTGLENNPQRKIDVILDLDTRQVDDLTDSDQEQSLSGTAQNIKSNTDGKMKPKSICKMMYIRDIGLVAATNGGTIKFFDSFSLQTSEFSWKKRHKNR